MKKYLLNIIFILLILVISSRQAPALEFIKTIPSDGSTISNPRPHIQIEFSPQYDLASHKGKINVKLNDEDITSRLIIFGNFIAYIPDKPLAPGQQVLTISYPDQDWKIASKKIVFNLLLPNLIKSIVHNGIEPLASDEVLVVTMEAPPNGKAEFAFGDLLKRYPMKEKKPGIYEGEYNVPFGEQKSVAPLVGYYTSPDGTMTYLKAPKPVNIYAMFFKVYILSPSSGQEVENYFTIKGKTRPGSDIQLIPQMTVASVDASPRSTASSGGKLSSITAKANDKGEFEVFFGFPIRLKGMRFNFSIYATDPQGNRSLDCKLWVVVK